MNTDIFLSSKLVVIKIGSALIAKNGKRNLNWIASLVDDIVYLKKCGVKVVIVSSGAVALGRIILNSVDDYSNKIMAKQAYAAVGQIELIKIYQRYFNKKDLQVAQVLLTIEDSDNRLRYVHARDTLVGLLDKNIIPIINENDTVAVSNLRIGDNDRLSARVAVMIDADLLVLLSDVEGLYTKNPKIYKDAEFIPVVEDITKKIENMAGSTKGVGTGGMITKITAAKIATSGGCAVMIALGIEKNPLRSIIKSQKYTLFVAKINNLLSSRRKWLVNNLLIKGEIIIDNGAREALVARKSLLPVGIKSISGKFTRGDHVTIYDIDKIKVGVGIIEYSSDEIKLLIGKRVSEIKDTLGFSYKDYAIHSDNLVLEEVVQE